MGMDIRLFTNNDYYQRWRDSKLSLYRSLEQANIELCSSNSFTKSELIEIHACMKSNNFVILSLPYSSERTTAQDEQYVIALNAELGLTHNEQHYILERSASALAVITPKDTTEGEFIPYTSRKLNWHTDGYYNSPEKRIRSFTLHCTNPATQGGANHFMDIEMVYILLREENAELTQLLLHPEAMSIPAHIKDGNVLRAESIESIFMVDELSQSLYMRYTQRKRNITFHSEVEEAVHKINELLSTDTIYHHIHTLEAGQGIISHNAIHTRDEFVHDENNPRVMLRGRYFNRVS